MQFDRNIFKFPIIHCSKFNETCHIHLNLTMMELRWNFRTIGVNSTVNNNNIVIMNKYQSTELVMWLIYSTHNFYLLMQVWFLTGDSISTV